MSKGIPTTDSKAIQEYFKLQFESTSFSLNPPMIDDWQVDRIKRSASRKAIEAEEKQWLAMQFKIMDIATPLINLLCQTAELEDHVSLPLVTAAKGALNQWARAFHHATRRRRQNVSQAGTRAMAHLLDKPEAFDSREGLKLLFGKTFEDAMVAYSNRQLTLSQAEAAEVVAAGSSGGPSGNTRNKKGPPKDQPPAPAGRGRGRGHARGRGGGEAVAGYAI